MNDDLLKGFLHHAREDYFTFLALCFPSKVKWNWHHRYVCKKLDQFIRGKDITRLMVFMPPQHQKTTMLTEFLPPYAFGLNPDTQSILTMYNATLAAKYNRKIQRVMDSEIYRMLFPDTRLNEKNVVSSRKGTYVRNSDEFEIVGHQGFLKTVGVGGGIAGTPAKLALLDDVIKNKEEAHSAVFRNKVYDWYTDELEARLHNDSKVAFTITRRHEDDLAGRLLDRDGTTDEGGIWEVVTLEAIRELIDDENDPREMGEALFPQLHSRERLEYIREKSARTWASLYQQRPSPVEGSIIKKQWFEYFRMSDLPNRVTWNFFIDGAYTKKTQNDFNAIICYAVVNNNFYVRSVQRKQLEFPEMCRWTESVVRANGYNNSSIIRVEPKANGLPLIQQIKRETRLNIKAGKNPTVDKISRVHSITSVIESGRVYLLEGADWVEGFVIECTGFPNVKNDDRVDALEGMISNEISRKKSNQFLLPPS